MTTNRTATTAWKKLRKEFLANVKNHICQECSQPVDMSLPGNHPLGPSVDHILPVASGGTDDQDNLQLVHLVCNKRKSRRHDDAPVAMTRFKNFEGWFRYDELGHYYAYVGTNWDDNAYYLVWDENGRYEVSA